MDEQALQRALHDELEKRVAEVSSYTDESFGMLGSAELVLIAVVAVLIPIAIVLLTR